ncbi:M-phase phosphoprotein 8-like isoform X1 [Ditylenchus destructor]|uniref:M-phase phosphoprotein 8-like isoform X1 n=1 Tax=Ditylenchus destructor TaxID=166010 RepID=A0AAD4NHV9_9BILA|nr:M-phase phosphoprotein 8-like isoform X1 [Ditylenchus destructor]
MDEGELVLHLDESEDTDDKSPPPTEKQNSKSTGDAVGGAAQNGENSGNIKSLVRSDTPAENENDRNSSSKVNEQKAIDANQEDKTAANVNEANTHKKSSNGPTVTSSVESNEKEDIEASRGRPTNKERGKGERTSSRSMGSSSTSSDEDLYSDGSSQSSAEVYEDDKKKKRTSTKHEVVVKQETKPHRVESSEESDEEQKEEQETWYGIKPDQGPREARRLFVADRIPTKTEKILAEVDPGVRVLRNHLRARVSDVKSESPAPTETKTRQGRPSTSKAKYGSVLSDLDSEGTYSEATPPPRSGKRGRATKQSPSPDFTSQLKANKNLGDIFTCEDNVEEQKTKIIKGKKVEEKEVPKIKEEKKEIQKEASTSSASARKQHNQVTIKRKRPREIETDTKNEEIKPLIHLHKKPAEEQKKAIFMPEIKTEHSQMPLQVSKQTSVQKSSKDVPRPPSSPRPASTIKPPSYKLKPQEPLKRPIQRTIEEKVSDKKLPASQKKSPLPPAKTKLGTIGTGTLSKSSVEVSAKQKRLQSLDLPLSVIPALTDLNEYIAEELKKAEPSPIQLSQQEFEEAVMDGKVDKVRAALAAKDKDNINLDSTDGSGLTLLHKLCEVKCNATHTQCELIEVMVTNGARMDAIETSSGQIPLHAAIANRRICHVKKLLALRSPVNTPDYSDQPPIVTAFNCSDAEFINALLNAGATFQPAFRNKPSTNKHLLKKVISHQARLQSAFDKARNTITSNMTAKPISPIFVNPLYESRNIEHSFRMDEATLPGPNCAFMVFTCLCDFSTDRFESRMWSWSPVVRISINNRDCKLLQESSKFVFLAQLRNGFNMLNIELNPSQCDYSDLKLLTQVFFVQLHRNGANPQQNQPRSVAPVQPMQSP